MYIVVGWFRHADLALAMLEHTDYPSIGYNFANVLEPATENLWELQDAPFEGIYMYILKGLFDRGREGGLS